MFVEAEIYEVEMSCDVKNIQETPQIAVTGSSLLKSENLSTTQSFLLNERKNNVSFHKTTLFPFEMDDAIVDEPDLIDEKTQVKIIRKNQHSASSSSPKLKTKNSIHKGFNFNKGLLKNSQLKVLYNKTSLLERNKSFRSVGMLIPRLYRKSSIILSDARDGGSYEDKTKFWPPPIVMLIVSIIQIIVFVVRLDIMI